MAEEYGLFAYAIPLLSLLGITIMLVAGISKLVKWWLSKKYVEKVRRNMKGGNKNGIV